MVKPPPTSRLVPRTARARTVPFVPFCVALPSRAQAPAVVSQRAMRLALIAFCVLLLTVVKLPPT